MMVARKAQVTDLTSRLPSKPQFEGFSLKQTQGKSGCLISSLPLSDLLHS